MLALTLHTHMYPMQYSVKEEDNLLPDEEELIERYLLDMERLESDWLHDTMLYNEAYHTDTNYFNLNKLIKHL